MPGITTLSTFAKPIQYLGQAFWQAKAPEEEPDPERDAAIARLKEYPTICPPVQLPPRIVPEVYHRTTRTQDILQVYHTYDRMRFHKIYMPNRLVIDKAMVRGRTNCYQGLHWIFRLANAYFKTQKLVIKIDRSRVRQWRSKKKISADEVQRRIQREQEEERAAGHDFTADPKGRRDYIISTAGVPRDWQLFLEDYKRPRHDFDLPQWEDDFVTGDDHDDQGAMGCPISALREKWFTGDFDEALVEDGLDMMISVCDCSWKVKGVNRYIDLSNPEPCYEKFQLDCWGCKFAKEELLD